MHSTPIAPAAPILTALELKAPVREVFCRSHSRGGGGGWVGWSHAGCGCGVCCSQKGSGGNDRVCCCGGSGGGWVRGWSPTGIPPMAAPAGSPDGPSHHFALSTPPGPDESAFVRGESVGSVIWVPPTQRPDPRYHVGPDRDSSIRRLRLLNQVMNKLVRPGISGHRQLATSWPGPNESCRVASHVRTGLERQQTSLMAPGRLKLHSKVTPIV